MIYLDAGSCILIIIVLKIVLNYQTYELYYSW